MENPTEIKRNPQGLETQIVIIGIAVVAIGIFATWLFRKLFGWTEHEGMILILLSWVVLFLILLFSTLKLWIDWHIKRYEVGKDALIVHAKAGKLGKSQTIYRYESILSLRMTQGFLGKRFGYGDIRITIPKIPNEIILNDIADPEGSTVDIQRRMNDGSSGTAAAFIS